MSSSLEITQLLIDWSNGDSSALERVLPLVELELRRIASHYMQRERAGHTLQTTALVNEAYLRFVDQKKVRWQNRAHFFGIAAQLMRRILLDHARNQHRQKRGGFAQHIRLSDACLISSERSSELIALDEALQRLERIDARKSQVVEMRYFGGMSVEETAAVLQVSPITVIRDWNFARAWLRQEISNGS
jgi:RNA polymerase sigma-70 factor, ECF subfamily